MSLKFKGDKPKKKKRSHRELDDDKGEGSSSGSVRSRYGKDVEGWVLVLAPEDMYGPLFVTSKSSMSQDGQPLALSANPINHKVYPFVLPEDMTAEEGEPTTIDTIWRCARVPESDDKVTLKSAQERFLACDQVGLVSAEREARGPQEEFVFISMDEKYGRGAFAVQSAAYGKYLGVDEIAGGKLELRCDADTIGDDEIWYVKMQAEFLGKVEEERVKKQRKTVQNDGLVVIKDLTSLEEANIRKFQARGEMNKLSSGASRSELKKAMKEGRAAEAMLDRRMKLKSDRYC